MALVCTALLAGATDVSATTPGRNGLIAFTRYRLQNAPLWSEIFVVRPDGGGARRVSHSAKPVEDDQAHWSPDGRWIVFERCPANAPCSVWLVRSDGSRQHRLLPCSATGGCNDSGASFAPDGKHIVFARDWGPDKQGSSPGNDQVEHSAIVETDLDGKHPTILRRADAYSGGFAAPRISSDGRVLLFDRYRWNPERLTPDALYVVGIGGNHLRRLTPFKLDVQSGDWSPDGTHVLFKSSIAGVGELTAGTNLYVVDADRTHLRRITNVGTYHYVLAGSFAPDGTSIVFATDANATSNPRGGTFADIFTMRLGTHSQHRLTRTANLDGWPSWGSTG